MSKSRNEVSGEVSRARTLGNTEANLRLLCKDYDEEELQIALDSIPVVENGFREIVRDAIERLRHKETLKKLDSIERPNWFEVWGFRFVVIAAIIAALEYGRSLRTPSNLTMQPPSDSSRQSALVPALASAPAKLQPLPAGIRTNTVAVPAAPKK
jgi:hypothetical protein